MPLTSSSRASAMHCLHVRFMVKSDDAYIFTFHKLHKSCRKGKAPSTLYFYKYPKDQELCVVSALNEYLKCTETWRTNGDKFQLLFSYIIPMWRSIVQQSLNGSKKYWKKLELMLMFLKVTLNFQPLPQNHVYQAFQ